MASGKKFELQVFEAIKQCIERGEFISGPELCKVYHQKGYYSKERRRKIFVDVSVEIFLPNALEPSMIWIFECKDYKSKIPVEDLEEFHAKLQQIKADGTKGTVICSKGAFQSSAINYAKSNGIGLARLLPDDKVGWSVFKDIPKDLEIQHLSERQRKAESKAALSVVSFKVTNRGFYGMLTNSELFIGDNFYEYLEEELQGLLSGSANFK